MCKTSSVFLIARDLLRQDKNSDLSMKIEEGFGPNGLGIISVTDVRAKLLSMSSFYLLVSSLGKL